MRPILILVYFRVSDISKRRLTAWKLFLRAVT